MAKSKGANCWSILKSEWYEIFKDLDACIEPQAAQAIDTLCIIMTSATFKSLYGNDTKRLKLPQIRKKSK